VNRDDEVPAAPIAEVIGWLAFVLFVGVIWRLRHVLDRGSHEH